MTFTAQSAIALVRQATVQIRSGNRFGTGFYVAHNILVTCAHVLPAATGTVDIHMHGRELTGRILLRLPALGSGDSYPHPDIAFIGVEQDVDTPWVEIRPLRLTRGEDQYVPLQIHGYNRETPDPLPVLDYVSADTVQHSGNYLKVAAAGIVRGMSGGPVIDAATGYVCGLLKYFRADQGAAWFIDGVDVLRLYRKHARLLGAHEPRKTRLIRPEPGSPLHMMLSAQRTVAEELPYRVVEGEVPLSDVYVEQSSETWRAEVDRAAAIGHPVSTEPVAISPYAMLARHRHVLVVGGPGGGKSTLMQHLVAESAAWWLRPEHAPAGDQPAFGAAIAVRCPASRLLRQDSWSDSVAAAVNAELGSHLRTRLHADLFAHEPLPGVGWLVLIDGLDEVLDAAKRQNLMGVLADRIGTYGNEARFVVSSRPLAQAEFLRLRTRLSAGSRVERLGEYNLLRFDRAAVESFAARWFTLRTPSVAEQRMTGFLDNVRDGRLMALVSTPLICTIAADIYQRDPEIPLPAGRTEMYRRFVDNLLYGRRTAEHTRDTLRNQLAPLGRKAEEFGEYLFDERESWLAYLADLRHRHDMQPAVPLLHRWLHDQQRPAPPGVTDEHIRELMVSTGIIVNRGEGMEFTHQSIADYFVGDTYAAGFDAGRWLKTVETSGADSVSLFTLDRWAQRGNDPMPVVEALAAPGTDDQFARLPQLAAVLEDGTATSTGHPDKIADLTLQVVRRLRTVTPANLPAINQALRAVLQRAGSTTTLVTLANDPNASFAKRVEAAKVLTTDADTAEDRARGCSILASMAYVDRVNDPDRLSAVRALIETGDPAQRSWAIAHLAGSIETSSSATVRALSTNHLVAVGQIGAALAALTRRAIDPNLPMEARADAAFAATHMTINERPEIASIARAEDPGRGLVWTRPPIGRASTRPEHVYYRREIMLALSSTARFDLNEGRTLIDRAMRDRSLTWSQRADIAESLRGWESDFLALEAIDVLLHDCLEPPARRAAVWWHFHRNVDPRVKESIVSGVVTDPYGRVDERMSALAVAAFDVEDAWFEQLLVECAQDPTLPPALRLKAAVILRHGSDSRDLGLNLLAAMRSDTEFSRWTRWRIGIHMARAVTTERIVARINASMERATEWNRRHEP